MNKRLISKKGSQEVKIIESNGCVVIWTADLKKHTSKSVTIFDELLIEVASRLSSIAIQRRKVNEKNEQ